MKIWKMDFELDQYDNLVPTNQMSIEEIKSYDGRIKAKSWNDMQVTRMEPEKKLKLSNAPGFYAHIPVFDKKSIETLHNFLDETIEVLKLKCEDGDYYLINILNVLDCIDYEKSIFKTFKDEKRIMRFIKYHFKKDCIDGYDLFKIKDEPLGNPFVTDAFRSAVIDAKLTGFKFKLVWDSENEN